MRSPVPVPSQVLDEARSSSCVSNTRWSLMMSQGNCITRGDIVGMNLNTIIYTWWEQETVVEQFKGLL